MGSPGLRRGVLGRLPGAGARDPRDPRLGGGALSERPSARRLRIRWLGRVDHADAHALQLGLFARSPDDHLLLLEHPHVYTLGASADPSHVLVEPETVGARLVRTDRGGDVTYHGPGQLVGYPILTVPGKRGGGMADTAAYVRGVEELLIGVLRALGLDDVGRVPGMPGAWVEPEGKQARKIAAVGVRLTRGRSMHGFALNVDPDLAMFDHIVPCGIADRGVTSLAAEGLDVSMREVVDLVADAAVARWAPAGGAERADVAWRQPGSLRLHGRLAQAGVVGGQDLAQRKPPWLRAPLRIDEGYLDLKRTVRELRLTTVCEEAGCPNIFECWSDGTATFMLNGERCTRACGFCLVDTRRPDPPDPDEARHVADAVEHLGLSHAVLTAVARDDLPDGGAAGFVAAMAAIRERCPETAVEVLVPDFRGDPVALGSVLEARPDVFNHNLETVARLQRAVRPSAGYARSLGVLARAADAGLVTKSGLMVGLGEEPHEIHQALADLRGVGVDIVTIGQYLRPTARHLPVARFWTPEELDELAVVGRGLGIAHVEASPLTRSSYHARQAAEAGRVAGAVSTHG